MYSTIYYLDYYAYCTSSSTSCTTSSTTDTTTGTTTGTTGTTTGGPKNKPVDKNRDGIDDVTNMPVAPDGGGGLGDKAAAATDFAKRATSAKSDKVTRDPTDTTDTPTSDDPNTNKVLSLDPPEVQGPKGIAWKKDTTGQWKKSVHPFTSATPELAAELDKILAGGMKPNAKQAELIDFVSKLTNAQKTQLKDYIAQSILGRGLRASPGRLAASKKPGEVTAG